MLAARLVGSPGHPSIHPEDPGAMKPKSKPLTRRSCTGTRHGTRPAPDSVGPDASDPGAGLKLRPSRMSKRRAAVLIAVHLVIIAHIVQWRLSGSTVSPVEPSESMQTLEQGRINAGFVFFCAAILSTFICGLDAPRAQAHAKGLPGGTPAALW